MKLKAAWPFVLLFCIANCLAADKTILTVSVKSATLHKHVWGDVHQSHVSANLESVLNYQVSGEVTDVYADSGQSLRQGQKLAQIDTLELSLLLKEAEMNLASAKSKYELDKMRYMSYKKLYKQKHASKIELQRRHHDFVTSKSAYIKSAVMVKVASSDLKDATLRAPFDLRIHKRYIQKGQVVAKGEKAFDVYCLSPLEVEITVPESGLSNVHVGDLAKVYVKSLKLNVKAAVDSVGHKSLYASSYPVILSLKKPSSRIKPGMQVEVRLAVKQSEPLVSVPLNALVGRQEFV